MSVTGYRAEGYPISTDVFGDLPQRARTFDFKLCILLKRPALRISPLLTPDPLLKPPLTTMDRIKQLLNHLPRSDMTAGKTAAYP